MKPRLIALSGPAAGTVFDLEADETTLGRDGENDIVIEASYVSRHHCAFLRDGESFRVVDRGSHNGTSVNSVPVTDRLLSAGDHIGLGGTSLLFADPAAEGLDSGVELDDSSLPTGATVQLDSKDSLYLHPERLVETAADDAETRGALAAILELTSLLGASKDEGLPDEVLNKFVELLPAERSAVLIGSTLEELESLTMRPLPFAVSRTLLARVLEEKTALLSNDVAEDATGESLIASKVRSLVALPLILDGRVTGAIYLDSSDPKVSFPPERLDLLVALASISAAAIEKARQMGRLRAETRRLREEYDLVHEMVGESPRLKEAQQILSRVAPTDTTVLIEGESGTGKELAARAIHFTSERKDGPLVKVDCTGLNENLLASELFGHEKGAFTGAVQQKRGKIEIANGGTVFLDEIGELPLALQSQLLRVLQDREFERVGGTRPVAVDIRLVAATNRDLAAEVKAGRFREDLYYRLNVVRIELPPLRERRGDVALLAQYFVAEYSKRVKRPVAGIAPEALSVLERHDWPGNVRELSNTIERAVVLGGTELIIPEDLPELLVESRPSSGGAPAGYHEAVAERKKELILDAVERASGNITEAGALLGLHPNYLHRLISKLGLRDRIKSK